MRGAPSLDIVAVDELRAAAERAFTNDPVPVRPPPRQGRPGGDRGPTYDRTLLALQKLGAELIPIALEDDGIDVDALGRALDKGARPKLAHVIPNFHNPAGCTLSREKRERLLELAREHDFIVFEDDPYVELRFEGEDQPTMLSLDDSDHVVYASSFSKTVCPGIRVGYLVGPEGLIGDIRKEATETYISPSMVSQSIALRIVRSQQRTRRAASAIVRYSTASCGSAATEKGS